MQDTTILWADDEIDLLKPHILFLNEKGYKVTTVTNGNDAVDAFKQHYFDLVFLDENMPGLTGLETLQQIKNLNNDVPIVLITKNEEEYLMEDAIGSKIDDYLIKPVHPKQILLTIKKLTENKRLVTEKTTMAYQMDFRTLGMTLNDNLSHQEWVDVYKKLIYWELVGMEIDNVLIDMDGPETPIMDGSSIQFVDVIMETGLVEQDADREYYHIPYNIHYSEADRKVEMVAMPLDDYRFTCMVDYNSRYSIPGCLRFAP
jgi:CheY-like chemotaxis protein